MKIYHNPRTLFSLAVCVVAFSDWMLTAFLSQGLGMVVLYPWSYGPSSFPGFLYGRVIWTHDSVFELDIPWSYSPSSFPDSLYMYSGTVSLIPWSQFFPRPCLVELSCFMILFFLWLFLWGYCIPWPRTPGQVGGWCCQIRECPTRRVGWGTGVVGSGSAPHTWSGGELVLLDRGVPHAPGRVGN